MSIDGWIDVTVVGDDWYVEYNQVTHLYRYKAFQYHPSIAAGRMSYQAEWTVGLPPTGYYAPDKIEGAHHDW